MPLIDTAERAALGGQSAKAKRSDMVLKLLVSFAVGGLLGDVFLHLIPDSMADLCLMGMGGAKEGAEQVGLPLLGGMLVFFLAEKAMVALSGQGHVHGHAHGGHGGTEREMIQRGRSSSTSGKKVSKRRASSASSRSPSRPSSRPKKGVSAAEIRPAAYLNLLADSMHNFTDGLAMGVTFAQGETCSKVNEKERALLCVHLL